MSDMIQLTDVNKIVEIIRLRLIEVTDLEPEQIVNALSLNGPALEKRVGALNVFKSATNADTLLILQLKARPNEEDVSMTIDNTLIMTNSYAVHCIVYGNNAPNIANLLFARLKTEGCRQYLYQRGVHIEEVTVPISADEFKNDIVWRRYDIDINVSCEISFDVLDDTDFETFDKPNIITY